MKRIEFVQPKPRIQDWHVRVDGHRIGSVWQCGESFRVSIARMETAASLDDAFKCARKQVKGLKL